MQTIQVTLGTGATRISKPAIGPLDTPAYKFQFMVIQNNSGDPIRVGDATVTIPTPETGTGILIGVSGTFTVHLGLEYTSSTSEWYIAGTSGTVVDILLI